MEAILDSPATAEPSSVALICHPHPLHEGTMHNKVVYTLARTFVQLRAPAVRFNFRGVGNSEGGYADAVGETEDALAVLDWITNEWPQASIWLAGFSFGAQVALRASTQRPISRLVTVAPPIQRFESSDIQLPVCPWLIVQGDSDELVDAQQVVQWVGGLNPRPQLALLTGVDHFFMDV
ncbi:MAG: alpha/beta fold hydrolase [Gammaproteobacteria bacterium]|nr:alpha/beta fold hydrolase [Gammaproteobacteria bacterium]